MRISKLVSGWGRAIGTCMTGASCISLSRSIFEQRLGTIISAIVDQYERYRDLIFWPISTTSISDSGKDALVLSFVIFAAQWNTFRHLKNIDGRIYETYKFHTIVIMGLCLLASVASMPLFWLSIPNFMLSEPILISFVLGMALLPPWLALWPHMNGLQLDEDTRVLWRGSGVLIQNLVVAALAFAFSLAIDVAVNCMAAQKYGKIIRISI